MNLYTVIRSISEPKTSRRNREEIVKADLLWAEASTLRDDLQKKERAEHPERTSWTSDIFYCRLQGQS